MKKNIDQLIQEEEAQINRLTAAIHEGVKRCDESPQARERWERVCEVFCSYQSPLNAYYERAFDKPEYSDKDLIDFVIRFLELDPYFFRSGYMKARMLGKLKRSLLSEPQKARLRGVLVDAVRQRGTREFREYCRLAAVLVDSFFLRQVEILDASKDPRVASRARMMLEIMKSRNVNERLRR